MNNKFSIVFITILMLFFSIWGVAYLLTIRDTGVQMAILGVIGCLFFLLSIKPKYGVDFKFLLFVIFGYFFFGKGFAYLSPAPPLYVGEIFFLLSTVGVIFRTNMNLILACKVNLLNLFILVSCIYAAFRILLIDFDEYGVMALRDSAMVYYSFIALACSIAFLDKRYQKVFAKVFPYFLGVGFVSYVLIRPIVNYSGLVENVRSLYRPHVDVAIPCTIALAMAAFYYIGGKNKLRGYLLLVASLYPIATDKTAFAFCFLLTCVIVSVWGKMRQVLIIGIIGGVLGTLASLIVFSANDTASSVIAESDIAETLGALESGNQGTTTGWRLSWWKIVFRDTYNEAPILGLGFGSDITSNFMKEYMGVDIPENHAFNLTRYPHNILFTIFGRLGFVGLIFFMIYSTVFLNFCRKYCKVFIASSDKQMIDVMLAGFVLAGFFNSLVQSTYENPYAGIPHWVCLGVMMGRYHLQTLKNKEEARLNAIGFNDKDVSRV